jgi:hypothetical protein
MICVVLTGLAVLTVACEGGASNGATPSPTSALKSATPVMTASPPPRATAVTVTVTAVPPTRTPSAIVTVTATPPSLPPGRREELAPVERVEVIPSGGGSATARITSGLPSGCAVYSRAAVSRSGNLVKVEVYNHLPTGNVACTMIYGIVTKDVPLGDGFILGVRYTIDVNGVRQQFTLP